MIKDNYDVIFVDVIFVIGFASIMLFFIWNTILIDQNKMDNRMKQIALERYDAESNNCLDKSIKLTGEFKKQGYYTELKTGWVNGTTYLEHVNTIETEKIKDLPAHAWVLVCANIEATTGEIISMDRIQVT